MDIEDEDRDGEEEEEVWRDLVIKKRRFWSCFGGRSFGAMKVGDQGFYFVFFQIFIEGLVGIIDETMQVILATIGFIFLVIISFFSSALVHMVAQGTVFFQLNVSICKFLSIFISYGIESCHKGFLK